MSWFCTLRSNHQYFYLPRCLLVMTCPLCCDWQVDSICLHDFGTYLRSFFFMFLERSSGKVLKRKNSIALGQVRTRTSCTSGSSFYFGLPTDAQESITPFCCMACGFWWQFLSGTRNPTSGSLVNCRPRWCGDNLAVKPQTFLRRSEPFFSSFPLAKEKEYIVFQIRRRVGSHFICCGQQRLATWRHLQSTSPLSLSDIRHDYSSGVWRSSYL
jgi:hypothetical protein